MKRFVAILFLPVLALLIWAGAATGATPAVPPPAAETLTNHPNHPIHFDDAGAANPSDKSGGVDAPNTLEPTKVVLALLGVLVLIFILRWAAKKFIPGAAAHRSTRAMKVLSRCIISPKQHLLLVQVGRRLVVVGDAGSQLNPLCQITDAEEVSALLLQIQEEAGSSAVKFESLFGLARKSFGMKGNEDRPEAVDQAGDSPDAEDSEQAAEAVDPAVAQTSQELAGLSDKVRGLARLLGRA